MTHTTSRHTDHVWSIILAGGEGERTRPFIQQWLGYPLPKQYCTFVGKRSMLRHTLDRADQLTAPDHKVTVVSQAHDEKGWRNAEEANGGLVIRQPKNCDTAAGVFLPLTAILARDPQATVVLYPSDHFIFPEDRFVTTVHRAVQAAQFLKEHMIVLGVRPTSLELEYGWVSVGGPMAWSNGSPIRQVTSFIEKPDVLKGLRAMADGALWNTMVVVAKAQTVWNVGWQCFPDLMTRFERLRAVSGTPQEAPVLQEIYEDMPRYNFSADLIEKVPTHVGLMELEDVLWSDWGHPKRIVEMLRLVGKKPVFWDESVTTSVPAPLSQTKLEEV